jgi:hypothetical protein
VWNLEKRLSSLSKSDTASWCDEYIDQGLSGFGVDLGVDFGVGFVLCFVLSGMMRMVAACCLEERVCWFRLIERTG